MDILWEMYIVVLGLAVVLLAIGVFFLVMDWLHERHYRADFNEDQWLTKDEVYK